MRFSTILPLLAAAGVVTAQNGKGNGKNNNNGGKNNNNNNNNNNNGGNNGGNGGNVLALNPANVQSNSNSDGLQNAEAGQAASTKDPANFINFCTGKTLTNGLQVKGGSCNGIPMGDIPSTQNMVSTVLVNPKNGDNIQPNQAINFQAQIQNLVAGKFTNPDVTYYSAPQALQGGKVVGHTHISVQDLGNNINPTQPPNAQNFAFFKGINDAGNGNGLLSANLAAGLPAGNYRVCTLTSAANHQLVQMPVAQRGGADDCVRFTVGGGNGGGNGKANANANAGNGKAAAAAAGGNGKAAGNAANAGNNANKAAAGQGKAAANAGNNANKGGQGAKKGGRRGRLHRRFASREMVA